MTKIDDDGELIPYAKKHLVVAGRPLPVSRNRLAELWPEPDWIALARENRYAPRTLSALAATYWSLGCGPMDSSKFDVKSHEWPALYDAAIAVVRRVFEQASNENLAQLRERAYRIAGINRDSSVRERMRLGAAGRFGGRKLFLPFTLLPKLGWLHESMADLGWPQSDSCLRASVGVISEGPNRNPSPTAPVWMVITTSPRPMVVHKWQGLAREEALRFAHKHIVETLQANIRGKELRKTVTSRANLDRMERRGPDHLRGRDVSTKELMQTFRLRGIQFGESLPSKERQRWVNETYCALLDLARVLDFEPGWLGLCGKEMPSLALAIGARGQGGAMAHFEARWFVLNLTRVRGAGSLAHEWAHALDFHLARSTFRDGLHHGWRPDLLTNCIDWIDPSRLRRPDAWGAFRQLASVVCCKENNAFLQQARKIEALKGARKRYWTSSPELFARSFEAYVQDRLEAAHESSPWLVHGTRDEQRANPSLSAYPLPPQRGHFGERWSAFLQALRGKASTRPDAARA